MTGFSFFFFFLIYLFYFIYFYFIYFIFGCVGSSLLRTGLSLVAASRGYSSLRCMGFSLRWLLLLWSTGFRHVGFSSCGARAPLLHGMWDLPGPGLEPMSPALAGGFPTTAPPGKPDWIFLKLFFDLKILHAEIKME